MIKSQSKNTALRASQRVHSKVHQTVNQYAVTIPSQRPVEDTGKLKITFLGGQDAIGEKNMQVVEWGDDAVVLDCGNDLSIDLPGVNYAVNDPTYLESIKHKVRGYVISHGHLDHLGGLRHIAPNYPAPIYGSRFTLGVVEKSFEDLEPDGEYTPTLVPLDMDAHEQLTLGVFTIELVRVTHSVPESACIVIDTPVGRIINSGDFRLDPEPLDSKPTDMARLRQLGAEGVLVLMSESTYADKPGRQLTEHTLQQSFHDIITQAEGRVFVSIFSSNINRIQMIINAAIAADRRVALEGRSMMNYAEIAIRQGILKIPQGTILPMREMPNIPVNQVLVICTGGQGEPGSALRRMAEGEHKHITLRTGDTVVISSNPIPGNEVRYQILGNDLASKGVRLYRSPSHELDGCGPLHVGGHARRDEHRELLDIVQPTFFVPIYGGALHRSYHGEIAISQGWKPSHVIQAANGQSLLFTTTGWTQGSDVPHGSLLIDQTGAVVPRVVVKDRLLLAQEGVVTIVLTIDKQSGTLMTSPDIISRGLIDVSSSGEFLDAIRRELKIITARCRGGSIDRLKIEVKDHLTQVLFDHTGKSPIVIPVINIVNSTPRLPKRSPANTALNV